MIKRTFFFTTRYFYHYCNSNWQHNGTTVCGHKKKSKYHSTSIIVFYNVIINLGCSKHQRKKHSISRNWQNFMHTKVKSIGGRWAITWALTLISSHFNQKFFLNVHSFPFAASYCIYSFCSSYCSVGSFLQLNNAFMVHFCIIKMQCWVNDEEIWTNHWGTCPLLHCVGQTIH